MNARQYKFLARLVILALSVALIMPNQAVSADALTTTVVTPASTDWGFVSDNGTSGDYTTGFDIGPSAPPVGTGSANITLNSAAAGVILAAQKYQGTRLADIQVLSYFTYTNLSPAAMTFQINYDPDLTDGLTAWYGRLTFEPYMNGTVTNGAWQTWDMLNGGAGKWWASGNGNSPVDDTSGQATPCSLSTILATWPNIGIRDDANSAILFKAGSNWNGFDGNIDNLNVQIGGNLDVYDFEPLISTYYVDDSWSGVTLNADPDGTGPALQFGVDSFATIQGAIDAAGAGASIYVYPGDYNETASGRTVLAGTPVASGTYQFGLFFPNNKPGLSLVGVDATGAPITDPNSLDLPYITTNANNNFGESGIWVEGDDVTIQGFEIGHNIPIDNKTIEIVADGFTLKYSNFSIPDGGGSVYFGDWQYDAVTGTSAIESYTIDHNVFDDGTQVAISSGAGYSGAVAGRLITNNVFAMGGVNWPGISFNGIVPSVGWYVYPVGGATITGNTFSGSTQYIRSRGTVGNDFDWASYWNSNTYDKKVMAGPNPPAEPRAYTYMSGIYSMTNTRVIGSVIADEVIHAEPGDTVLVGAGTYDVPSVINLDKANLKLQGTGNPLIQVSDAGERIHISAPGVMIDGFRIEKTDKTGLQNIIAINASNTSITNNKIFGKFVIGDPEVSRAIVIYAGNFSGLNISNNEIYDLRQPAYISGTHTGTISDNYVYRTKGWVLEGGNLTFTNNTWGTGADANVFDIAIIPQMPGLYYTDIVAMSNANNGAVIEDQRVSPAVLSVAYVDAATSFTSDLGGRYHPYSTIAPAITRVVSGGTIHVSAGTYSENLVINKSLTLAGAGAGSTVVMPAVSDPNCGGTGGGSLCAGSSNVILVQADNVVIHDLTVDGDNTALAGGFDVGGANVDARNGIITNHSAGVFTGLEVYNTTVKNIYLRGMYASSGGTFNFHHNTVTNVQAEGASIAMFAWYGPGTMANNNVSYANDAISANHSKGIQFLNNVVTHSGSGVHTDNAGDGGGVADLIQGNTISDCNTDGYGIFVFVPYIAPTVNNNTINNCAVGLSAWGQGLPVTTQFTNNTVTGNMAAGSAGVYITTDQIGYSYNDVSVNFSGNVITGFETGLYLTADAQIWTPGWVSKTITATFHLNQIYGNTIPAEKGTTGTYTADLEKNWWGSAAGPSGVTGLDYTPWCGDAACSFMVQPPAAFGKTSPVNGQVNVPTNLTMYWAASSGATSYEYCLATTADGCTTWISRGTMRNVTLSLAANTTYYWQVRAKNSTGTTYANDGSIWSFTTVNPPAAFGKTSPVNGQVNVPTNLTMYWAASSGATSYEYCLATTADGCTTWISRGTMRNVTLSLAANTTYYWQVRAKNSTGTTYANDGSIWSFTTVNPPAAFGKTSPVNGQVNVPTNLTMYWAASSGATSYEYCLATTADGCTTWISRGTMRNVTLSLAANTTYYWQVRAKNSTGTTYANDGSIWSFTTVNPPAAFGKTSPVNGQVNVPTNLTMYWAASSGATSYEYCLATTADGCTTWISRGTMRNVTLSLAANTTYYWQVRAKNSTGTTYANQSTIWSFTTRP